MADIRDGWILFAWQQRFVPKSHLTLTFDQKRRGKVSRDQALWWQRRLVDLLNRRMGGVQYRRKWSHSYFGYVVGVEHHRSGVAHLHMCVDKWIDFKFVHHWWNLLCGYAWINGRFKDDPEAMLRYVLKYVVKEDARPTWWFQPEPRTVVFGARGPEVRRIGATAHAPDRRISEPVKAASP